jgi:hypothetical protein
MKYGVRKGRREAGKEGRNEGTKENLPSEFSSLLKTDH